MRLNLESKYAATACWMGGDSRLPVCADQATGGSDRLKTAGFGPALCWISLSLSKGLSVTVLLEGEDGDGALGDKVSGYLGSGGVSRKFGCNISAQCDCNYKWIIESLQEDSPVPPYRDRSQEGEAGEGSCLDLKSLWAGYNQRTATCPQSAAQCPSIARQSNLQAS